MRITLVLLFLTSSAFAQTAANVDHTIERLHQQERLAGALSRHRAIMEWYNWKATPYHPSIVTRRYFRSSSRGSLYIVEKKRY